MIESYKNFERLRYRLNSDLIEIGDAIDKNASSRFDELMNQFTSGIISAIAASIITETSFGSFKDWLKCTISIFINYNILVIILGWVLSIGLYIVICVCLFLFINKVHFWGKRIVDKKKPIKQKETNYQKQFDNIACDSILVAMEYIHILNTNREMSVVNQIFYVTECAHYLEKASEVTAELCQYKDKYVKINRVEGIDVYRIHLMKNALNEVNHDLKLQIEKLSIADEDKSALENVTNSISMNAEKINI